MSTQSALNNTLRRLWTTTYNAAYVEAVRTAPLDGLLPAITGEMLVECHAIARKIAAETVHTEREARIKAYLANGYGWCMNGCGSLTSPGWAFCPGCEQGR